MKMQTTSPRVGVVSVRLELEPGQTLSEQQAASRMAHAARRFARKAQPGKDIRVSWVGRSEPDPLGVRLVWTTDYLIWHGNATRLKLPSGQEVLLTTGERNAIHKCRRAVDSDGAFYRPRGVQHRTIDNLIGKGVLVRVDSLRAALAPGVKWPKR